MAPAAAKAVAAGRLRWSPMTAGGEAPLRSAGVLPSLRAATAQEHARVESALDLLAPDLTPDRLRGTLARLHGFWLAAEDGLDAWAAREPSVAGRLGWPRRRRAALFAADLSALGGSPAGRAPALPHVVAADDAVGRMYVLEGSTLGGRFIDRHLAGLPALSGVRLRAFSPYGEDTGRMWRSFRAAADEQVVAGGDRARVVRAAAGTFTALAEWCERPGRAP